MERDLLLLKTLFIKAYNLFLEKNYADSIKLLTHTTELWIDYYQKNRFLTLLGMNYFRLGKFEKAERVLLESLAIFPDNIKVLDLLGQIYFYQQRYIESEKAFLSAKRNDEYNFNFALKTAKSAWKAGNYARMFKRLKESYIPDIISAKEQSKLKEFLLDFLRTSEAPNAYILTKNFRKWCFNKRKNVKKFYKK